MVYYEKDNSAGDNPHYKEFLKGSGSSGNSSGLNVEFITAYKSKFTRKSKSGKILTLIQSFDVEINNRLRNPHRINYDGTLYDTFCDQLYLRYLESMMYYSMYPILESFIQNQTCIFYQHFHDGIPKDNDIFENVEKLHCDIQLCKDSHYYKTKITFIDDFFQKMSRIQTPKKQSITTTIDRDDTFDFLLEDTFFNNTF